MAFRSIKQKNVPVPYVKRLAQFVLKHNTGWHQYNSDKLTRETVNAGVYIGFVEVNEFGYIKLKSESRAKNYLGVKS